MSNKARSLPGAIAAYGLAVGISHISETLPAPVYALLSGLNGATVGIIALAAVQLSQKAITDKLTRILVFFGGTAGMLYNALWYFPILMVAGGLSTIIWDYKYPHRFYRSIKSRGKQAPPNEENGNADSQEMQTVSGAQSKATPDDATTHRTTTVQANLASGPPAELPKPNLLETNSPSPTAELSSQPLRLSWKSGLLIIAAFLATFIVAMVLRGTLHSPPRGFSLFANLYLAGTIIFGGGPVVIPLLREYVVYEGWVSPRDFLLGLAIIQAFPGPNFNFAVYLGALAVVGSGTDAVFGAMIGYVAIFAPGLALHTGMMGLWKVLRRYRWFVSGLRGINATAVGLIYAAVYRLWEIGFLSGDFKTGTSLGTDPWFLVIAATAYTGGMWFKIDAPVAILLGGVMGMIWYGVVTA
jgi:chromate transport protein ChrA